MSLQKTKPKKPINKTRRINTVNDGSPSRQRTGGAVAYPGTLDEASYSTPATGAQQNRTSTPTVDNSSVTSPQSEDESFDAVVPVSISPVRPITATSTSAPRPTSTSAPRPTSTSAPRPTSGLAADNFKDLGEIVETHPAAISYEPANRDEDLPDLGELIETLDQDSPEAGFDSLDGDLEPPIPSLFSDNDQIQNYGNIYKLTQGLETESITDYVDCFNKDIKDEVLMVGQISLEQVQQEEQHIRDEHIRYQAQEVELKRKRELETLAKEDIAKKRVAQDLKSARKLIKRKEELQKQKEKQTTDHIHKTFRRAENQLVSVLEKRKAEIKTTYGDLLEGDGEYGGSKGRRWRIDWNKTPQPIEVKLKCLRGIKDKVPMGRYVCIVSLHNRLGGHVLRWSKLKGQQWSGSTMPVRHEAKFYNTEIKLNQSVFTALPPMADIRPGMVLMFELFLLRGAAVPCDQCVAWGVFPIADGKFQVIQGKFKVPLLRGETNALFDNHGKIESLMATDIDHWMCNLYIEIVKLPRYLAGQKEYEVELQFSSGILAHPDRVNTFGEQYRDGAPPDPGTGDPAANEIDLRASETSEILQLDASDTSAVDELMSSNNLAKVAPSSGALALLSEPTATSPEDSFLFTNDSLISHDNAKKDSISENNTTINSKFTKTKNINNNDSTEDSMDGDDICLLKKGQGFYPVQGQSGLFYKKHALDAVKNAHKSQVFQLLPQLSAGGEKPRLRPLTYHEQLAEHTFSVKGPLDDAGKLEDISHVQTQYLGRQFVAEMGASEWRSRTFWSMMSIAALVFFLRMYMHYVCQWVYLRALNIPINKMEFLPYTVNLNYQNTLLQATEEVSIILIGSFSVILLFSLLVFVHWVLQKIVGPVPDICSQFILVLGVEAFMDPWLIMLIDCIIGRYKDRGGDAPIADFMKLYYHYLRAEGSGLTGILIYVFLLFFTCFISLCILYMYFLRLHNNGRLLDIFWRLHGEESTFHVPLDLEVSNDELAAVLKSSEEWRGEQGERRKTAVYDYIWEQEKLQVTIWDPDRNKRKQEAERFREITTHIAVHTLHLDGLKELYRHWLRTPNGAIVEVFGDMAVSGMNKQIGEALQTKKSSEDDEEETIHSKRSSLESD